jgi:hypothetical protein
MTYNTQLNNQVPRPDVQIYENPPNKKAKLADADLSEHLKKLPPHSEIPSLFSLTASFVINNYKKYSLDITKVGFVFRKIWADLKSSEEGFEFGLNDIMMNVEDSEVELKQIRANWELERKGLPPRLLSDKEIADALEKHCYMLFESLAREGFTDKNGMIFVDISSYVQLEKAMVEKDLMNTWDEEIINEILGLYDDPPPTLEEIRACFHTADWSEVTELSYEEERRGPHVIPPEIMTLTQLQVLTVGDNSIVCIPDSIANLTQLRTLHLHNTDIRTIPDSLTTLSNLKELNLHFIKIKTPGRSVANLSQLESLSLVGNEIKTIPDDFFDKLALLRHLNISETQISKIPTSIASMSQLQTLSLNDNQISEIPDVFTGLSQLRVLNLSYNQISEIPVSVANLNLDKIDLRYNKIKHIPDSLTRLVDPNHRFLSSINVIPDVLPSDLDVIMTELPA